MWWTVSQETNHLLNRYLLMELISVITHRLCLTVPVEGNCHQIWAGRSKWYAETEMTYCLAWAGQKYFARKKKAILLCFFCLGHTIAPVVVLNFWQPRLHVVGQAEESVAAKFLAYLCFYSRLYLSVCVCVCVFVWSSHGLSSTFIFFSGHK